MTNSATLGWCQTSWPVLRDNMRQGAITRIWHGTDTISTTVFLGSFSPNFIQYAPTHTKHTLSCLNLLHLFMLSRRRGAILALICSANVQFRQLSPCWFTLRGRALHSERGGRRGSLTPFSGPSKWELWRGSLISLSRFALSPAPPFPATHLWWLWTGLISVCHWPVRRAWVCVCFSREKAVNKMTLLFPLSYHVEKPIMVMLSMSGNLCLSLLSPVLFILALLFSLWDSRGCGFIGPDTLFGLLWGRHTLKQTGTDQQSPFSLTTTTKLTELFIHKELPSRKSFATYIAIQIIKKKQVRNSSDQQRFSFCLSSDWRRFILSLELRRATLQD